MNRTRLLSLSLIIIAAVSISSCKPSRVWATKERDHREDRTVRNAPAPPPPSRNGYYGTTSLIISPTPGFTMNRFSDGRYYHRSSQGLLYWKGYDNRFFLDKSYFNRVSYSKWEYKEWKKFSKQR